MAPLSDDGLSVAEPTKKIYEGWQFPKNGFFKDKRNLNFFQIIGIVQ